MKIKLVFLLLALSFIAASFAFWNNRAILHQDSPKEKNIKVNPAKRSLEESEEKNILNDKITVASPKQKEVVKSPLDITGQAKGNWFFEASFPVSLVDKDGIILANGTAQAQGEWMTDNFVPFTSTLEFAQTTATSGFLILKKDNPSGLSENDEEIKLPILFK